MTWVILPGMDGTGDLSERFATAVPPPIKSTIVRFPATELLSRTELIRWIESALPQDDDYLLIAESFSGPLAIGLAGLPRLCGVVLCGTFATPPMNSLSKALVNCATLLPGIGVRLPKWAVRHFLLESQSSGEDVNFARAAIEKVAPHVLASRLRMILQTDALSVLASIKAPILIVAANRDRLVPRRVTSAMRAVRPDAVFVTIDSPHLILFTRPTEAVGAVMEFVRNRVTG